jgi:hypothetical protein
MLLEQQMPRALYNLNVRVQSLAWSGSILQGKVMLVKELVVSIDGCWVGWHSSFSILYTP